MKRIQFIECGIVVIGLLLLYNVATHIFALIFQLFYFNDSDLPANRYIIRQVLVISGLMVITYALLRYSRSIAGIFARDTDTSQFAIRAGRRSLLQIALIIAGIAQLFQAVPTIVTHLTKKRPSWARQPETQLDIERTIFSPIDDGIFYTAVIIALFALFIIFCSGPISRAFFANDDEGKNDMQPINP